MTLYSALNLIIAQVPELDDRAYLLAQLEGLLPKKSKLVAEIRSVRREVIGEINTREERPTLSLRDFL